jgi:NADH dehydrogenase
VHVKLARDPVALHPPGRRPAFRPARNRLLEITMPQTGAVPSGAPDPPLVLVAGGTGTLGRQTVARLAARGLRVRVLTRDPARARPLEGPAVEVAVGDVRQPETLARAAAGARTVVSAVHGFVGPDAGGPQAVDWRGNLDLFRAAADAGVEHVVLLSAQGAAPNHPMELYRMKHRAEEALRASGLAWTILRATAFMETWAMLVGEPLVRTGKTTVFGRGRNPINFVSAHDVAAFVELAVTDPALRGETVDVGGPESLTFREVVATFERETGRRGATRHVPLPVMRLASVLMRPLNPGLARQIQAGVVMDTFGFAFDGTGRASRFPSIPLTTLAEVVRRDHLPAGAPASAR